MRSIGRCIGRFGWKDMSGGVVMELSETEVKCMLLSVAWRNVKDEWRKEVHNKPKLFMMKLIGECEMESSCALLKSIAERRMMLKLRGGTAAFQIEMDRWHGMKREERVCKECNSGEVEDVCMLLAFAVLCKGPSQATFSGSHGGIKKGLSSKKRWREGSPCIVAGL